jgi:hypothetical protein
MTENSEREVPEGAAVFPLIPPELNVNPLLLAVLHATIFLAGSDDKIVDTDAADEAVQYIADYVQRLEGAQLLKVREDMACLVDYGRRQKWPKQLLHALKSFLSDLGVE